MRLRLLAACNYCHQARRCAQPTPDALFDARQKDVEGEGGRHGAEEDAPGQKLVPEACALEESRGNGTGTVVAGAAETRSEQESTQLLSLTSSRLNRTPPMGAPKAALTPAAAPPETKS